MTTQTDILAVSKLLRTHNSKFPKIRIGSLGDGGYVLPDDLSNLSSVLSIGIGYEDSFDLHFAKQGIPIYQYDHTVESAPAQHENYHFNKMAWGSEDTPTSCSLQSMIMQHGLTKTNDAILKFDTEGAEWDSIPKTNSDIFKYFRIIVCELHGLTSIANSNFREQVRQTLQLLLQHHTLVHLHANNCCGIGLVEGVPLPAVVELTLLRNDRSVFTPSSDPMPGPLDFPNMLDRPELILSPYY